jgi:acetylornithine deacetylase
MTDLRDAARLTAELVAVDSVNPSLVPGAAGETEAARAVAEWAAAEGLRADVVDDTLGRPSVLVRGGTAAGGATLMLCGHLDTVGHEGMRDPLVPLIEAGRLHGRGAYDMKGGLAAALVACRDADRAGIRGEVVVAAVADEEHASIGVQDVLRHVQPDAAVVTEPTELAVVTAHKGFVWVEIEVLGRAAHGSRPHLGVDAIRKTGPVLLAVGAWDDRLQQRVPHPLVGVPTVHASLIAGGSEVSIIPDRCLLTVERRTTPGETEQDVQLEVDELLRACREADPELRVTGRTTLARDPFETPPEAGVLAALTEAAAAAFGSPPRHEGASFWADSALLQAAGIPTVLFGPLGEGAHAETEWVDLASLDACVDVLTRTAVRFCR